MLLLLVYVLGFFFLAVAEVNFKHQDSVAGQSTMIAWIIYTEQLELTLLTVIGSVFGQRMYALFVSTMLPLLSPVPEFEFAVLGLGQRSDLTEVWNFKHPSRISITIFIITGTKTGDWVSDLNSQEGLWSGGIFA